MNHTLAELRDWALQLTAYVTGMTGSYLIAAYLARKAKA